MDDIYAIKDRKFGYVLKNKLFSTRQEAKVKRNSLNQEEHKEGWEELTIKGSARYCVVPSHLHPKNKVRRTNG